MLSPVGVGDCFSRCFSTSTRWLSVAPVEFDCGTVLKGTTMLSFDSNDPLLTLQASKNQQRNNILRPSFKFSDMGIGGLDLEFGKIFRRAFASRTFPPNVIEKLGISHVRGR